MKWSNKIKQALQVAFFAGIIALSGCGGGNNATNTTITTATNKISLTGVVVSGTMAAGVAVGAVGTTTSTITGAYPNAIVIAADKLGNTMTATADKAGKFTITLDSGTSYAIVFFDPRTLKLLGSLVQASNTANAGAVNATGDSDLGNVVINASTGLAVSENDAKGTLKNASLAQAPSGMDADGDGIVTRDEVSALQAKTVASGNSKLTTISLVSVPNVWAARPNEDVYGAVTGYDLSVDAMRRIQGPANQGLVNAIASTRMTYYSVGSGYAGGQFNSSAFIAPPANISSSFQASSWIHYDDITNNRTWDNKNGTWEQSSPLNFTLGQPYTWVAFSTTLVSVDISVIFDLAKENGGPYVFTDVSGFKRAVVTVDALISIVPNPKTCGTTPNLWECKTQTISMKLYAVLGYNTAFLATDAQSNLMLPSDALAKVTFGKITTNTAGKFVSATNENSLNALTPMLTNVERDQVIAYLWNNSDAIVLAQSVTNTNTIPPSFSMIKDAYGNAALPIAYVNGTYIPNPLSINTSPLFTASINYISPPVDSTFQYELRSGAMVIGSSSTVVAPLTSVQTALTVSGSVKLPTFAVMEAKAPAAVFTGTDYSSGTPVIMKQGFLDLWLVMRDGATAPNNILSEQFIDTYLITK